MTDSTNADVPQAGIQLSGDAARQAAIKRLKKQQEAPTVPPPTSARGY
jgi:hypothetical protein